MRAVKPPILFGTCPSAAELPGSDSGQQRQRALSGGDETERIVPVDFEAFRAIVGAFPTGVTIVTAIDDEGVPRGLTSNALSSVSANPPLLLVCVDKSSQTLPALQAAGAFVVNFMAVGREELSNRFASKEPEKFAGVRWKPSEAARGAPILEEDSVAYAECVTTQVIEAGDHWIFVAQIESGRVLDGTPLMYFRRTYAPWPGHD